MQHSGYNNKPVNGGNQKKKKKKSKLKLEVPNKIELEYDEPVLSTTTSPSYPLSLLPSSSPEYPLQLDQPEYPLHDQPYPQHLTHAEEKPILILCGALLRVELSDLQHNMGIRVLGNKIIDIYPHNYYNKEDYADVIDLTEFTVLPGLIDSHCHILIEPMEYQFAHLKKSSAYKALQGLKVVQALLNCGWTTIRIPGDADVAYAHLDIKRAIEAGLHDGPRIVGAGHYLSATGGGGDMNDVANDNCCVPDGRIVDGPVEIMKAIREEIKYGSTWIKLLVTGAFMNSFKNPTAVHFSKEELEAATSEAARHDIPVMAHAHSPQGILAAIDAGVRSIEHGTFIDKHCIDLMKRKGVYLVPTFSVFNYSLSHEDFGFAPYQALQNDHIKCISAAIQAGVKIALGTDYVGWKDVSANAKEFIHLQNAGMTSMAAIRAATVVASELLMMDDKIGSISPNKLADIIAVKGNPLEDLSVLENVFFVMKDGKVIKRPA